MDTQEQSIETKKASKTSWKNLWTTHKSTIAWCGITAVATSFVVAPLTVLYSAGINVANAGNLGDAIGGLTAPIIGFSGALLVYLAFQQQMKANAEQRRATDVLTEQYNQTRGYELCKEILSDLLQYRVNFTYEGMSGINDRPINWIIEKEIIRLIQQGVNVDFSNLRNAQSLDIKTHLPYYFGLLSYCKYLCEKIDKQNLRAEDKDYLLQLTNRWYNSYMKINWAQWVKEPERVDKGDQGLMHLIWQQQIMEIKLSLLNIS